MKISIDGQRLSITEDDILVSGSIGEYLIEFEFSDDWEGYIKTAVFEIHNGETYTCSINEDKCVIPQDALKTIGYLKIGCFGINIDKTKTTTFTPFISVYKGAFHMPIVEPVEDEEELPGEVN